MIWFERFRVSPFQRSTLNMKIETRKHTGTSAKAEHSVELEAKMLKLVLSHNGRESLKTCLHKDDVLDPALWLFPAFPENIKIHPYLSELSC